MINKTMGSIFTAGEDFAALEKTLVRMKKNNPSKLIFPSLFKDLGAIIDYAKEESYEGHLESKERIANTSAIFKKCIEIAAGTSSENTIALKITAYLKPDLLRKLNSSVRMFRNVFPGEYDNLETTMSGMQIFKKLRENNPDLKEKDLLDLFYLYLDKKNENLSTIFITKFEWLAKIPLFFSAKNMQEFRCKLLYDLNDSELEELSFTLKEIFGLLEYARKMKVGVFVDAEQSYFQEAIDQITIELGNYFNKDFPLLYNTFQHYLIIADRRIDFEIRRTQALGLPFIAKIVRGAYIIEERTLENVFVKNQIEETHQSYNRSLKLVIPFLRSHPHSRLVIATHNEKSIELAHSILAFNDCYSQVSFAQLLGLGDHITYRLTAQGISVSKYVPFAPTEYMIPYLTRRAQESWEMIRSGSNIQSEMIKEEISYRLGVRND